MPELLAQAKGAAISYSQGATAASLNSPATPQSEVREQLSAIQSALKHNAELQAILKDRLDPALHWKSVDSAVKGESIDSSLAPLAGELRGIYRDICQQGADMAAILEALEL